MTSKIPLKPKHLSMLGIFALLAITPRVMGYVRSRVGAEVAAAQQQAVAVANEAAPAPSQIGSTRITEAVLTRATFLMNRGRESGDVEQFITDRYKAVNDELWELSQQVGVFDGDAEAFARLANLSAEQQAAELVQFWLLHPEYVHTASGMSVQAQPAAATQGGQIDYANVQP